MKNQRGQVAIEMVLMTIVMVGAAMAISVAFRENQYIASLVSGPWKSLSGMIQNGVWGSPESTMKKHPAYYDRLSTVKGEKAK